MTLQHPAPGTWVIDPAHTNAGFVARHLMVTKVRGKFADVSGTLTIADDATASSAQITLAAASITTESDDRDGHLKSPDFLDVDNHKELTFRSTAVEVSGSTGTLTGDLTIKGVTNPVTLDFEFHGVIADPWGNPKAAFTAEGEIDREDWGLTWNVPLDAGGVLVSKKIKLEIEAQAAPAPSDG